MKNMIVLMLAGRYFLVPTSMTVRMKTAFVLMLAGLMGGCTVAQSAQYATARYCFLPPEVRAANREAVAFAVAPNRVQIQCAGDRHVPDAP